MDINPELIYKIVEEVLKETSGKNLESADFVKEKDPSGVCLLYTSDAADE